MGNESQAQHLSKLPKDTVSNHMWCTVSNSSVNCLGTYCRTILKGKTRAEIFSHAPSIWVTFLSPSSFAPSVTERTLPFCTHVCLCLPPVDIYESSFRYPCSSILILAAVSVCSGSKGGWREHKLSPNWRNQFSFLKSDRLSFIAYWLHGEIIIMFLLSVKDHYGGQCTQSRQTPDLLFPRPLFTPRVRSRALSRSTICYLASSVRALGYKEGINRFGHRSNKQRENERVGTSLLQSPTTSVGGGAGGAGRSPPTSLRSHHMFGCHPYSQQLLERGTVFV